MTECIDSRHIDSCIYKEDNCLRSVECGPQAADQHDAAKTCDCPTQRPKRNVSPHSGRKLSRLKRQGRGRRAEQLVFLFPCGRTVRTGASMASIPGLAGIRSLPVRQPQRFGSPNDTHRPDIARHRQSLLLFFYSCRLYIDTHS